MSVDLSVEFNMRNAFIQIIGSKMRYMAKPPKENGLTFPHAMFKVFSYVYHND